MDVADKKTFKVSHRIVSSTSMVVSYKRLFKYDFGLEIDNNQQFVYDLRSPSKENNTLYNKLTT